MPASFIKLVNLDREHDLMEQVRQTVETERR